MRSSSLMMPTTPDTSDLSREQFLQWHYSHQWIYVDLKRIAFKEKAAGRETMTMSDLLELYEKEELVENGKEDHTIPRCYAPFYLGLLSSHNTLWAFLRLPASIQRDNIGG